MSNYQTGGNMTSLLRSSKVRLGRVMSDYQTGLIMTSPPRSGEFRLGRVT